MRYQLSNTLRYCVRKEHTTAILRGTNLFILTLAFVRLDKSSFNTYCLIPIMKSFTYAFQSKPFSLLRSTLKFWPSSARLTAPSSSFTDEVWKVHSFSAKNSPVLQAFSNFLLILYMLRHYILHTYVLYWNRSYYTLKTLFSKAKVN